MGCRVQYAAIRMALPATVVALAACDTPMNALDASGDPARRIATLGWFMIVLSAIIFIGVVIVLAWAVSRNRRTTDLSPDLTPRGRGWIVYGGALMPTLVLVAIFVVAMSTLGMFPVRGAPPVLTIHVTGRQWWWQIDYLGPKLQTYLTTANEIHIPVGQPVRVLLTSADVIHSFWVPKLQGKLDLIPGDTNDIRLRAERPGEYRGQCAEYCGLQHAHMAFTVVADDSATFARWWRAQLEPATPPADSLTQLGQRVFVNGPCVVCHTVRGTPARGQIAPDLTHVGSRRTIAAGVLPNSLGALEGWIANAQSLKPGTQMPNITQFNGRELRALAAYVYSLK
ncbi:MAG TPA: cytochrome c oxidase subunit II [Gemmatimonadaceae bacterium]|jgi:cytochrome c oxidase subunit 2